MSDKPEQVKLQKLLLHPGEDELQLQLFDEMPIRAIASFLDCFDSGGRQAFEVPPHVIAFLQKRLQSFMQGDHASIDKAFGGCVAKQRKTIKRVESDRDLLWDLKIIHEEAKKLAPTKRLHHTPFEFAVAKIAKKYNKSADAVRDAHKRSLNQ